jgi:hypothetical protein
MITKIVLAGTAAALFAAPAFAHHSFAMFDQSRKSNVEATVKDFEWINPHIWLHVDAPNAEGKMVTWSFEAGSIGQLTVSGWKRDTVKAGDKVTVGFHPLRDGSYGGQLLDVKLPDGRTLCQGAACRAAAGVRAPAD